MAVCCFCCCSTPAMFVFVVIILINTINSENYCRWRVKCEARVYIFFFSYNIRYKKARKSIHFTLSGQPWCQILHKMHTEIEWSQRSHILFDHHFCCSPHEFLFLTLWPNFKTTPQKYRALNHCTAKQKANIFNASANFLFAIYRAGVGNICVLPSIHKTWQITRWLWMNKQYGNVKANAYYRTYTYIFIYVVTVDFYVMKNYSCSVCSKTTSGKWEWVIVRVCLCGEKSHRLWFNAIEFQILFDIEIIT